MLAGAVDNIGVADPWGVGSPPLTLPAELPAALDRTAELTHRVRTRDLPAVRAARDLGWFAIHDAPLYFLLPAAWPRELRAWVPDPRFESESLDDEPHWGIDAGLPRRPAGRVWLLRSPWPKIPVSAIYELLWTQAKVSSDHGIGVYEAGLEMLAWHQDRAWLACPVDTRELIEAWAQEGRVGTACDELVELELTPASLTRTVEATGFDEHLVLQWRREVGGSLDDEETINFIREWRAAGLPVTPPQGIVVGADRQASEFKRWMHSGFELADAMGFSELSLDDAITWRAAGFTVRAANELLELDREITTEEAREFETLGFTAEQRSAWVTYGFSALDAQSWAAAGLKASEARLWRARSLTPADIAPGRKYPVDLFAGPGNYPIGALDRIPDPPGTRGSFAARHRTRD